MKIFLSKENYKNRNLIFRGVFNNKMNFSTLILPEISNGKIHPSVLNLAKAAKEIDDDVNS